MSWDDWMSWLMISSLPLDSGDQGERDSLRSHPAKAIVLMLILMLLLGIFAGIVWLIN